MRLALHHQILIALVLGSGLGLAWPAGAEAVAFVGDIFLLALKMLIMPLILASMTVGVASIGDVRVLGHLGGRTVALYVATTLLAVILGLILVNVIRPGRIAPPDDVRQALAAAAQGDPAFGDSFWAATDTALAPHISDAGRRGAVIAALRKSAAPDGELLEKIYGHLARETLTARIEGAQGKAVARPTVSPDDVTVGAFLNAQIKKILVNPFQALAEGNVLAVIVFGLALGIALLSLGEKGAPALKFFGALNDAMMRLVDVVMRITPFGVFALIAVAVGRAGPQVFVLLGKYCLTVLAGLLIHGFIVLPLLLQLLGKMKPRDFFRGFREAMSVAFSTSSSNATLPVTLECVEKNLGVSSRVASFTVPLGATINMDGTALYEAVAAMFIAQIYGVHLSIGAQVIVFLTSTLAAIGAAGIPSAGTVTMVMVLSAVGLPIEGIGLILAVDRVLDMCRTTVNVEGDGMAAVIIQRWSAKEMGLTAR